MQFISALTTGDSVDCVATAAGAWQNAPKKAHPPPPQADGGGLRPPRKGEDDGDRGISKRPPVGGRDGKTQKTRIDPAKGKTKEEREDASEAERVKRAAAKKKTTKPETPRGRHWSVAAAEERPTEGGRSTTGGMGRRSITGRRSEGGVS